MDVPWFDPAGRKAFVHNSGEGMWGGPDTATTKPGRFLLSLPRPYRNHEPMLGRKRGNRAVVHRGTGLGRDWGYRAGTSNG